VPGLALTGRKILIQRRAHDRVHEPQTLSRNEDVRPDQVICRLDSHTECAILAASPALASRLYPAPERTVPEAGYIQPTIQR
jgi:hypothetical protein